MVLLRLPTAESDSDVKPGAVLLGMPQCDLKTADVYAAPFTFSTAEWLLFDANLLETEDRIAAIHAVLISRCLDAMGEEEQTAVLTPNQMRRVATDAAAATCIQAVKSIDAVEMSCCGHYSNDINTARQLLQARCDDTLLLTSWAASAEQIIHNILMDSTNHFQGKWQRSADKALKKTGTHARDVLMWRVLAMTEDFKSRDAFLELGADAYGNKWVEQTRNRLLLSYHKYDWNLKHGFVSNQNLATSRRRRKRKAQKPHPEGSTDGHQEQNGDLSSPTCTAALADQEYNTSFGSQPGHHQDDHSQSTYTCIDVPAAQASEVVGAGGLLPHMDEEAAHGPDPHKPGDTVQQQALPELSPTWSEPSCEWHWSTWKPLDYNYFQDGYTTAMTGPSMYTIQAQLPLP